MTKLEIQEEDIDVLDQALKKISDYKKKMRRGIPDYSPSYVAYLVPLSLALLKSESTLSKLTIILAILAAANILLLLRMLI